VNKKKKSQIQLTVSKMTTTSLPKDIEEILNKHLADNESDRGKLKLGLLLVVVESR
jgi:tartrate dehydratase alpha subunit/fumarate hydratase class I-like protein